MTHQCLEVFLMKIKELLSIDYYVIAFAIVLGSLIIAVAIIWGSGPRYQAVSNSGAIAVIDTHSGKFIFYDSCIPIKIEKKSTFIIPDVRRPCY